MKHLVFISLFTFVAALSSVAQDKVPTQARETVSFDKIKTSKGINVTLVEGKKEAIEVRITSGNFEDVITEVVNKELIIKMKTKIYKNMAVQVYVTYKTLRSVDAGSGSTIDSDNTIFGDKLLLSVGADAVIELDVDVNTIEASATAGRILLSGTCKNQNVTTSTGGKYFAYTLESQNVVAKTSVGGQIEVNVKGSLTASASTGGNIDYKGNPTKIDRKESMGGKINPMK